MNNWNDYKVGQKVYIVHCIEFNREEGRKPYITKPNQKAFIQTITDDNVEVLLDNRKFRFCFYKDKHSPKCLMSKGEYKTYKSTEEGMWKELYKFIKRIDLLECKSEDIDAIKKIIIRNNI